jgi:hypothetical protein
LWMSFCLPGWGWLDLSKRNLIEKENENGNHMEMELVQSVDDRLNERCPSKITTKARALTKAMTATLYMAIAMTTTMAITTTMTRVKATLIDKAMATDKPMAGATIICLSIGQEETGQQQERQ